MDDQHSNESNRKTYLRGEWLLEKQAEYRKAYKKRRAAERRAERLEAGIEYYRGCSLPVDVYRREDGSLLGSFSSRSKAARAIGLSKRYVNEIARGKCPNHNRKYIILPHGSKLDSNGLSLEELLEEGKKERRKEGTLVHGNSKAVIQFDKNGNVVAEYPSLKQAQEKTGIDAILIRYNCLFNKERPQYYFLYKSDYEQNKNVNT